VILDEMRAVLQRENVEGTIPSPCTESEQKVNKKSSGEILWLPLTDLAALFKKWQFLSRRGASSAGKPSSGIRHNHCCCSGAHSGSGKSPGMKRWANLCASSLAFELTAVLSHCAGEVEPQGLKRW